MANQNITLKDENGNLLYPKTFDFNVYNSNNQSLNNILATKVGFEEDSAASSDPSPSANYYDKSEITTLLDNKVDKSPTLTSSSVTINSKAGTKYSGSHICIESWKATDGTQWYRKYSDGWKECGGYTTNSGSGDMTITLPITFSNTNYGLQLTNKRTSTSTTSYAIKEDGYYEKNTTNFKKYASTNTSYDVGFEWYCYGY